MNEPDYIGRGTDFYVAAANVPDTVNLAVALKRPLLVEGEPGCGKTMLAYSVAAEKGLGVPVKFTVKSTSRANDLLYRFDAFRRLQDAQNPQSKEARYVYPYISLGPLGQVIHERRRAVVLIDEIDKADIDFPNDLLDVLDNFTFQIDELPLDEEGLSREHRGFGRQVSIGTIQPGELVHPIIIITSNREKRLPEPFLRRCLYIRLQFPQSAEELTDIVRKNTGMSADELNQQILDAAVAAFQRIRSIALSNDLQKPPSTSELIDWVRILSWKGETVETVARDPLLPPNWELLFKTMNDLEQYQAVAQATRK